ncbi:MAG: hypothetical protein JSS99_10350 [Actinobacteria bacterium]|nr:hypothetical protein [Actinomycetota bacterium]
MTVTADDAGTAVSLEQEQDFTRFHVAVRGTRAPELVDRALREQQVGRLDGDGQAHVALAALERLAGPQPAAWSQELEGMVAYARTKGWWDEDAGAIAAHVEWEQER